MAKEPEELKRRILEALEKVYPCDLSIGEVARAVGVSDLTASKYLGILEAEGRIEVSRRIGRAVLYRVKRQR